MVKLIFELEIIPLNSAKIKKKKIAKINNFYSIKKKIKCRPSSFLCFYFLFPPCSPARQFTPFRILALSRLPSDKTN